MVRSEELLPFYKEAPENALCVAVSILRLELEGYLSSSRKNIRIACPKY